MSKVMRSENPHCSAIHTAPVTPPAGPDSSIVTGASTAARAPDRPPSLRRMASSAPIPPSRRRPDRVSTYRLTCGCT